MTYHGPQTRKISSLNHLNVPYVAIGFKLTAMLLLGISLSACTTGSRTFFGDQLITGSTNTAAMPENLDQAMPDAVVPTTFDAMPTANVATAKAPFSPAMPINGGRKIQVIAAAPQLNTQNQGFVGEDTMTTASVSQSALPAISQQQPVKLAADPVLSVAQSTSESKMSATQTQPSPVLRTLETPDAVKMMPTQLADAAPNGALGGMTHKIAAGESLYGIALRYKVTTDALVTANKLASPDRIFVGQELLIPGQTKASVNSTITVGSSTKKVTPKTDTLVTGSIPSTESLPATKPLLEKADPASVPVATTKLRWPVTGRVISDFSASNDTGIAIEAPEGSMVRAAASGSVLYVGLGVNWYGNLVLVKHSNGLVSAYAHLKDITVKKGDSIERGSSLGTVGMTGAANRPQLHFELRKGTTPVNPTDYLAS